MHLLIIGQGLKDGTCIHSSMLISLANVQVDIGKAFDNIHWDFISQKMSKLGFGLKLANVDYWLYSD